MQVAEGCAEEQRNETHGSAIRGLVFAAPLAAGMWVAIGALVKLALR